MSFRPRNSLTSSLALAILGLGMTPSSRILQNKDIEDPPTFNLPHRERLLRISRKPRFPKTPHKHSRAKARKRARSKVRMRGHRHG